MAKSRQTRRRKEMLCVCCENQQCLPLRDLWHKCIECEFITENVVFCSGCGFAICSACDRTEDTDGLCCFCQEKKAKQT